MKCNKCGYDLEDDWKICPNCKEPIGEKIVINNCLNQINENVNSNNCKNNESEKTSPIVYIIVFLVSIYFFITLKSFFLLAVAIISLITGFILCPKSKLIKFLFIFAIVLIVTFSFLAIVLAATCDAACGNCVNDCSQLG